MRGGRSVESWDRRIGAGFEKQLHEFEIGFLGRQKERGGPDAEQYIAHVHEALFLQPVLRHASVHVHAVGDHLPYQVHDDVQRADGDSRLFAAHHAADDLALHRDPMQGRIAGIGLVGVGAAIKQQIGDIPMRVYQRRLEDTLA